MSLIAVSLISLFLFVSALALMVVAFNHREIAPAIEPRCSKGEALDLLRIMVEARDNPSSQSLAQSKERFELAKIIVGNAKKRGVEDTHESNNVYQFKAL